MRTAALPLVDGFDHAALASLHGVLFLDKRKVAVQPLRCLQARIHLASAHQSRNRHSASLRFSSFGFSPPPPTHLSWRGIGAPRPGRARPG